MDTIIDVIIGAILFILLLLLGIAIYFLPAIIAYKKKHANRTIILIINIIFGWTFIGWVGCLVWSFVDTDGNATRNITRNIGGNKYEDLARLQKLKENGTITETEFELEKAKLLK